VTHRDLKPDNIGIAKYGKNDERYYEWLGSPVWTHFELLLPFAHLECSLQCPKVDSRQEGCTHESGHLHARQHHGPER
jgi:hypothetical protein